MGRPMKERASLFWSTSHRLLGQNIFEAPILKRLFGYVRGRCARSKVVTLTLQKCSEMRFCLLQMRGSAALWLHSCSSERPREKDVMLLTFIQAGCS